jgi:hypothetical protein
MSSHILTPEPPQPKIPTSRFRVFRGIVVGSLTAIAVGLGGFRIIRDDTGAMGWVLFWGLPFITGLATAIVSRGKEVIFASLVIGAIACTVALYIMGLEGWVCILMSAPLIAFSLALGALIGTLLRQFLLAMGARHLVLLLTVAVLPFFLVAANKIEEPSRRALRTETITNTLITDAPRELVWNQLKTFDRIEGTKGLLMRIGLPVPVSCTMSGEGVGATRTCYFEQGHIAERVTEWNPPSSMTLEITEFDVPGRPWLSFQGASYELTTENGHTVVTRKTTIVSRLSPAWYWRPLEKIGVETEHEYLFEEVKKKIEGAK